MFFWSSKKTASFAGKGALSAKRWIWSELDIDTKSRSLQLSVSEDISSSINSKLAIGKEDGGSSSKRSLLYSGPDALDKTMESFDQDKRKDDFLSERHTCLDKFTSAATILPDIREIDMPTQPKVHPQGETEKTSELGMTLANPNSKIES